MGQTRAENQANEAESMLAMIGKPHLNVAREHRI
jgi:hypothetical protein